MSARDRDIYRRFTLGVTVADLARMYRLDRPQVVDIIDRQRAIAKGRKLKGKIVKFAGRTALALALVLVATPALATDWWAIGPLSAAMAADAVSTERNAALDGYCPYPQGCLNPVRMRERNPLPGMQSTVGRTAWAAVELAAVHTVSKKSRKWGRIVAWTATAVHIFCVVDNWKAGSRIKGMATP